MILGGMHFFMSHSAELMTRAAAQCPRMTSVHTPKHQSCSMAKQDDEGKSENQISSLTSALTLDYWSLVFFFRQAQFQKVLWRLVQPQLRHNTLDIALTLTLEERLMHG